MGVVSGHFFAAKLTMLHLAAGSSSALEDAVIVAKPVM